MKKKIIIILLILLLTLLAIILILTNFLKNNSSIDNNNPDEDMSTGIDEYVEKEVTKMTSKTTLNMLLKWLNSNEDDYCFVKEIYRLNKNEIEEYFVYVIQNNENKYFVAYLDQENNLYMLEEISNTEYEDVKNEKINNKFLQVKTIENNGNNEYTIELMSDVKIANMYFDIIKNILNSKKEVLYNILNTNYKQKKFGSIENFMEYVDNNKNRFTNMQISKYTKYTYEGYMQYVCLDTNGEYYIINEDTTTGDYKILLDTYTIDQPEFIENYDSASDVEKAGYNIDKFMTAINTKDYNYAYNHLAQSFKQNNFTTLESFINYIQNNFYSNNECEITNGQKEGNYYVYTVNISNANQENSGITQKNFVVNLKENREYELSFNIE